MDEQMTKRPIIMRLGPLAALMLGCTGSGGGLDAAAGSGGARDVAETLTDAEPRIGLDAEATADATSAADAAADAAAEPDTGPSTDAESDTITAPPTFGCEACVTEHAGLIEGLVRVRFDQLMSRVDADRTRYVPLVWGSEKATGGDKLSLPGTLPVPGWLGRVGAGRVVVWAGHEGAWTSPHDGVSDNDAFRTRLIDWLRGSGTRIGFSTGHQEWFGQSSLSGAVRGALEAKGVGFTNVGPSLDAAALSEVDVLIVGNPWGAITVTEQDAIKAWVTGGGAVLALGLGWSWSGYGEDATGGTYPMNQLGARLGFHIVNGAIDDPGAVEGTYGAPSYELRPLSEYQPLTLHVLRAAETDVNRVKDMAAEHPEGLYVIEGAHMGLALPSASWAALDDPAGAVAALDALYLAELAMVGADHPPFGGDTVWIVPEDAPDAGWWMHSGNPIVYQKDAAEAEIIARLNAEGHPGWGVAHEQGHNMHSSSCGDLFVTDVSGEVWPNVFGMASYRANGWDFTAQMGAGLLDAGHAYHAQPMPNLSDLAENPFILLGCLDLIGTEHGWDGMRGFLTKAAADHAAGVVAGTEAARLAYWVEGLSAAYQVDFAPLITHWGFPVTAASAAITATYPPSSVVW